MTDEGTRRDNWPTLLGIGAATAAAHIGNNFTTYLIGGLIDRHGFTPAAMGVWNMAETLSYAAAMLVVATRAGALSPRALVFIAGSLVVASQLAGALSSAYPALLLTRIGTGLGFGLANAALNLAAARTSHPARAISIGITLQTLLYAAVNIGLPMIGADYGVAGMFVALAGLTTGLTLAASGLPRTREPVRGFGGHRPGLRHLRPDELRLLTAMALFTFGSLAIWPFMERAAHAIGISAVQFGRYQSVATLLSAGGNLMLALVVARVSLTRGVVGALIACGGACAALTTVGEPWAFAVALAVYNMAWFITYPLLLGIAYRIDASGGLSVLCSATWLLMTSLASVATGGIAQLAGSYSPVGPMGMMACLLAAIVVMPLARQRIWPGPDVRSAAPSTTG